MGIAFTMEWIADPSIWAGLVTLIVIELVLGIDNLVFIAILAEKLPPAQRDKARITGLLLAMVMRLLLLASISRLVTLTTPLFSIRDLSFSARDLIMLFGGFFLLFKATMELNERLEGKDSDNPTQRKGAKFWGVVAQIVVLDAIFSLDSVITAVGMVDHGRDDGCGDYCHQPDGAGEQVADTLCQQPSNYRYSVPELPADDWFQSGGRRIWFPYPERLPVRGHRLLGDDRSIEPVGYL